MTVESNYAIATATLVDGLKHPASVLQLIQSLRSENENDYEFVCLVIVRMRSCPWHVTQVRKLLSTARRDLQMWVLDFQVIKNSQDVFFFKCVIHSHHDCGDNAIFFPWKH